MYFSILLKSISISFPFWTVSNPYGVTGIRWMEMISILLVSLSIAGCSYNIWPWWVLRGFYTTLTFCICVPSQILSAVPTSLSRSVFSNKDDNIWITMIGSLSSHRRLGIFSGKAWGSRRLYMCWKSCDFSMYTLLFSFWIHQSSAKWYFQHVVWVGN